MLRALFVLAILALSVACSHTASAQQSVNTYCGTANTGKWVPCPPAQGAGSPHNLDVSTVTTGGTAVTAITAGHAVNGAWIKNPTAATQPLCISITGTAATTESGGTTCVTAGQTYTVPPMTGAVSVNSTDSAHAFSGVAFY